MFGRSSKSSKPSSTGSKPSFTGAKPSLTGSKPSFTGSKPSLAGSKPSFAGSKPSASSYNSLPSQSIPKPSDVTRGTPLINTSLTLKQGDIYVVIFRMTNTKSIHWSLVLATTDRTGMMYHNTTAGGGGYHFEARLHPHLLNSTHFIGAVRISRITSFERNLHQHFANTLAGMKIRKDCRCRQWVKEAIYLLAEEGLIGFQPKWSFIDTVEDEAMLNIQQTDGRTRARIITSRHYRE